MSWDIVLAVGAVSLGLLAAGLVYAVTRRQKKKHRDPNEIYPLW